MSETKESGLQKPVLHLSRPTDRSLKAYKEWVKGITSALGGKSGGMSDEQWEKAWKEFWAKAKSA